MRASAAGAGWTVFTILVAQAVGMSVLLLAGVLIALTATAVSAAAGGQGSAASLGVTALGLLIVFGAGAVLVRRDLVLGLAAGLAGRMRRAGERRAGERRAGERRSSGRPGGLLARVEVTLARMRDIPLTPRATAGVIAGATAVWATDFLCLVCGFRAVHASVPWHWVLLAYGAAQVAGLLPVVPGGLGIVEGSLAVILVGYGASRVPAVSAVVAYRIVNYWLAIAVGWSASGWSRCTCGGGRVTTAPREPMLPDKRGERLGCRPVPHLADGRLPATASRTWRPGTAGSPARCPAARRLVCLLSRQAATT